MLSISLTLCVLLLYGVSDVDVDRHLVLMLTVKEGASVTLPTNAKINQKDRIKWFFQNTRIAQVLEHISSCTDVQCNEGTERFRDRLKLDHQTGSLTISDIQPADSGLYELQIISSITNTDSLKIFNVTVSGAEVFLKEGDSVTLYTGVQTNQQDRVKWYFYNTQIAHINGDLSKICTDVQCNEGTERFRDRLKLDHQTGSLTITNTTNTHSGEYQLQIFGSRNIEKTFSLEVDGVPAAERDEVKTVKQGESVTLPAVIKKPNDVMMWYFNEACIAEITGDQSQICEDLQCEERFRDRLKLDHQTGSLTITHTTNTDSGLYDVRISSRKTRGGGESYSVGVFGVDTDEVSVMEGDSVTLHTGVQTNQQETIKWYFNGIRIAQITINQSKICTDVQCNKGTERFRDRLKLDHQTGSLTITNITNTHSGDYQLQIIGSNTVIGKIFSVIVHDVPGAETDETKTKSVKEGESVTLDPGVVKNPKDVMTWYFNDIVIAEITGDQSQICTDDQCKERFRDRLKLDHQTGSLIIINTTNTDSGVYHLQIFSNSSIIIRQRSISIISGNETDPSWIMYLLIISGAVIVLLVLSCVIGKQCRKRAHPNNFFYPSSTRPNQSNDYWTEEEFF